MTTNNNQVKNLWLIGDSSEDMTNCILPTNRQVLSRFFHEHIKNKNTLQASARLISSEVVEFWKKEKILSADERNVIVKIRELHKEWQNLKKNKNKKTEYLTRVRNIFMNNLDNLFDISSAKNSQVVQDDMEFINSLKENKLLDPRIVEECEKNDGAVSEIKVKTKQRRKELEFLQLHDQSYASKSEGSANLLDKDDFDFNPPDSPNKSHKIDLVTDDVCAALDRAKVSNRNAAYILSAVCNAFQHNLQNVSCNAESIRLKRIKYREKVSNVIKKDFNPDTLLTVHWDGKLLPTLMSKETVDRLAVIVSGENVMKLLGVPAINNGTGKAQAEAVHNLIQDWKIEDRIVAMCFDTTASNSGLDKGACTLLENLFKKNLLPLACRHLIMELPVSAVFNALFEVSSGPNIKLFERFQTHWKTISKSQYKSALEDNDISHHILPVRDELITFFQNQMEMFQPRDDYKELLQLALLFLGAESDKIISIMAPGAVHRARWMAKIIYSLKIYLFRDKFVLKSRELHALREFNIFAILIYLKNWYTCPKPTSAPGNDLKFLKDLLKYKNINLKVAEIAFNSLSRHSWYLSEILVGLAFFEPLVPDEVKTAMVLALKKKGSDKPVRRIKINKNLISKQELPDFVTRNTLQLFQVMKISEEFLEKEPSLWHEDAGYLEGKKKIQNLKVINDAAERGISLIQNYNSILTNQEEQKQFLLQVVEKHRLKFPNSKKNTLIQGLINN